MFFLCAYYVPGYVLSAKGTALQQTRQESPDLMELTFLLGGKWTNKYSMKSGYKCYEE